MGFDRGGVYKGFSDLPWRSVGQRFRSLTVTRNSVGELKKEREREG